MALKKIPANPYKSNRQAAWWDPIKEDERRERLWSTFRTVATNSQPRCDQMMRHAKLYLNMPIMGAGVPLWKAQQGKRVSRSRLTYNAVKSCCDAFISEMCEDNPSATVLTSGGSHDLREKAKQLSQYLEGQFYEMGVYIKAPTICLDMLTAGLGFLKIFIDQDRLACDRVYPHEILVDDLEAYYGQPYTMYQRKLIDRAVLVGMFPQHEALILESSNDMGDVKSMATYATVADKVLVCEAWHRRSFRPEGDNIPHDGRHMIALPRVTLLDEVYDRDEFPFVTFSRADALAGYWPTGLTEELEPIQNEISALNQNIQRAENVLGKSHWMVSNESKIAGGTIDNDIGSIIKYTGVPPQVYTPQAVGSEIYQRLETLWNKAFEVTGISQLSAQGQIPANLNASGKALSTYADLKSKRFVAPQRRYFESFMNIAKHIIHLSRELTKTNKNYAIKTFDKKSTKIVKFLDVDLDEEVATVRVFPTNSLANDPAERMAQVQEMANAGWVDASTAKRLLDFPDLQAEDDMNNASYEITQTIISKALNDGEFIGPEPFMDLGKAIKIVQLAYLRAKCMGVAEDRLNILRIWLTQANDQLKALAPQAPPQLPPGGAPPTPGPLGGPGMATPGPVAPPGPAP